LKLTDLHPEWVGTGGEGITDTDGQPVPHREAVAISFDCPKCGPDHPCLIPLFNPLDGGPPAMANGGHTWTRTGDTFENLTLAPSIQRVGGCNWHGFIQNGDIINA
jgi:hypothetical protein